MPKYEGVQCAIEAYEKDHAGPKSMRVNADLSRLLARHEGTLFVYKNTGYCMISEKQHCIRVDIYPSTFTALASSATEVVWLNGPRTPEKTLGDIRVTPMHVFVSGLFLGAFLVLLLGGLVADWMGPDAWVAWELENWTDLPWEIDALILIPAVLLIATTIKTLRRFRLVA